MPFASGLPSTFCLRKRLDNRTLDIFIAEAFCFILGGTKLAEAKNFIYQNLYSRPAANKSVVSEIVGSCSTL